MRDIKSGGVSLLAVHQALHETILGIEGLLDAEDIQGAYRSLAESGIGMPSSPRGEFVLGSDPQRFLSEGVGVAYYNAMVGHALVEHPEHRLRALLDHNSRDCRLVEDHPEKIAAAGFDTWLRRFIRGCLPQ